MTNEEIEYYRGVLDGIAVKIDEQWFVGVTTGNEGLINLADQATQLARLRAREIQDALGFDPALAMEWGYRDAPPLRCLHYHILEVRGGNY